MFDTVDPGIMEFARVLSVSNVLVRMTSHFHKRRREKQVVILDQVAVCAKIIRYCKFNK